MKPKIKNAVAVIIATFFSAVLFAQVNLGVQSTTKATTSVAATTTVVTKSTTVATKSCLCTATKLNYG